MINRRGFLKLSGASLASLFSNPAFFPVDDDPPRRVGKARVATQVIYRYSEPSFRSERIGHLKRDQVIDLYEEVISPAGPAYNPHWYRLTKGYAHSGHLQRVDESHHHRQPLQVVPEGGQLGEICVPLTQSYRYLRSEGWRKLYRLYYRSVHWITGVEEGPKTGVVSPDGRLLHAHHFVPLYTCAHRAEELSLISPGIPLRERILSLSTNRVSSPSRRPVV
jgi:hypothetical protein